MLHPFRTPLRLLVVWILFGSTAVGSAYADGRDGEKHPPAVERSASSVRAELLYEAVDVRTEWEQVRVGSRRSVPLAFGMSAVVPGLGQAYNRQWVKAAVAVAAEAALIYGYTTWHNKGADGRDAYQAFAHTHWSPARYAEWINDYAESIGVSARVDNIADVDYANPDGWSSGQIQAVRRMIDEIRVVESVVTHPNGASFSHKLPYFGEQQYYELVGKYNQFAPGWDDYGYWTQGEDGEMVYIHPDTEDLSPRFRGYAEDHGEANDYLRRASRVSLLFIVNHLVAAVDAAVFAKLHNNRIQTQLEMGYDATGEPHPMATVKVRL